MSTNSSHEDSEEIKKLYSDKDELLQEMKIKNTVSMLVDEKLNKFLSSVKWVIGILSVILAFFGWSTFREMRDQIKTLVSEQIKDKISDQAIFESLKGNFNVLESNLVLENLKMRVKLYNEGQLQLIGDNDMIAKEYEPVIKNMIYNYDSKAIEAIQILNNISQERMYHEKDFLGKGFDNIKNYVDSALKDTKNQVLKFECIKFLINFSLGENEKFNLIMDNLRKSNESQELYSLLPRMAFYLQSNDEFPGQRDLQRKNFIKFCTEKTSETNEPVLLMSSYLTLLYLLREDDKDYNSIKKTFTNQFKNQKSKFPDFKNAIEFLLKFDFLLRFNVNEEGNVESEFARQANYRKLLVEFLSSIYKVNKDLYSDYLKGKLFSLSHISQDLYVNLFENLISDNALSEGDKVLLVNAFAVQNEDEAQKDYELIPVCYLKNKKGEDVKVRVNLSKSNFYYPYKRDSVYEFNDASSFSLRFEKNNSYYKIIY